MQIQEFDKFPEDQFRQLKDDCLAFHPFLQWEENLDDNAKAKLTLLKERRANDFVLKLGVIENDRLIAACYAFQSTSTDLMMAVSMVRPEYRGKGIYSKMCQRVLEVAKREGFQSVNSKHMMTNNPILIAKLKLGFKICGLEVHPVHGTLLNMTYSVNGQFAEALRFRSGEVFLFNEEQIYEQFGTP